MEKKIFAVDSQKLTTLQMCMKRYQYSFGKSFETLTTPVQFDKGTLIHHGLEFYYKAKQVKHLWGDHKLNHSDIVQQGVDYMRTKSIELQIDMEDVEDVIRVFMEYCQYYAEDGWDTIISVENTGSKIIYEDDKVCFVYEFKNDLIISLQNISVLPVDHKSYSRKFPTSDMNNQFMGYCWGLDTNNIVINKVGFQTSLKPADKFTREVFSYTKARLEEWVNNSIFWMRQGVAYIENNIYPMNLTSCDKYSGCSYRSICKQDPEDRDRAIQELYKIRDKEWDVGKHLE